MLGTWEVVVDGIMHRIEADGKFVTIDGGPPMPYKSFKKKRHFTSTEFLIPIGSKTASLFFYDKFREQVLTIDKVNCKTAEQHDISAPKWCWIFYVLYVINFLFIMGGALGAMVNLGMMGVTANVASNKGKSLATRILLCALMYVGVTVVIAIIADALGTAFWSVLQKR